MHEVLLLLGSNIEPELNIPAALNWLRIHPELELAAVGATFVSPSIGADGGRLDQPDFHNAAARVRTSMSAQALRHTLRLIEHRLGRQRSEDRYAARPIDLDIIFYGNETLNLEGSAIPDPDVLRYPHVAVPLANLAPDWIHPISGSTLRQLATRLVTAETEIHPL